ncbi:two-component system sensor protein [Xanthomonas fragariae]|nr:two-component system sensor protein [Xanthomonas fragariae]
MGNKVVQFRRDGSRQVLLIGACPMTSDTAAWTISRLPASTSDVWRLLVLGMLLIFAMVAVAAIALGVLVRRWSQRLHRIQQALAADTSDATDSGHRRPGTESTWRRRDRLGAGLGADASAGR